MDETNTKQGQANGSRAKRNEADGSGLELVISTELAPGVGLPAEIMFNYDELKGQLTAYVARYDGLVVGDGEIADARRIRAGINRVIGQLTKAGTETKAKWNRPLDTFLGRVRELVAIARPIEAKIGEQIRAHDETRRAARRTALADFLSKEVARYAGEVALAGRTEFAALPEDVAEAFLTSAHWRGCIQDEMLAASASEGRAKARLSAEARRCRATLDDARRYYGGRGEEWISRACYALARWDFDTATAFRDVDRQIAEAERIAARQKAQEEAHAKAEAERAAAQPEPSAEEMAKRRLAERRAAMRAAETPAPVAESPAPEARTDAPAQESAASAEDPEMTYTLRIAGPRSKLFALRDWLTASGLKFERV